MDFHTELRGDKGYRSKLVPTARRGSCTSVDNRPQRSKPLAEVNERLWRFYVNNQGKLGSNAETLNHPMVSKSLRMEPQTVLQTRVILLTAILLRVIAPSIFAHQAPEAQVGSGSPPRFADLLRAHNIGLTEAALLRALKNTNSDVRSLAAMKLEEDKAIDAIPAIKDALAAESVPRARVNIAFALGLFGVPVGYDELKKVCADKDFIPEFRLYAVRYMFDLHFQNDACLGAAKEIVESKDSGFGDRISAIGLLPQFQNLKTEESREILKIVLTCLDDPEPVVRMAASHALVSLGDASAVPGLQSAIVREKDENIRSVFEMDMKKLQRKGD